MADNISTRFQWDDLTRNRLELAWVRSIRDGGTEVRADANLYFSSRNHVFSLIIFCELPPSEDLGDPNVLSAKSTGEQQ